MAWLIVLGAATFFGLVESLKGYVGLRLQGAPAGFALGQALVGNMPWWYTWAAFTPLIVWLASRLRLDDDRGRVRALVVHVLASALLAAMHLVVVGWLYQVTVIQTLAEVAPTVVPGPPALHATLARWADLFFVVELFTYWGIVGAYYALDFYRRYRESAVLSSRLTAQASQLQLRVAHARLQALRMELNPHFLFNTLNAISGFVRKNHNDQAVQMLARLGDLLRATLDHDLDQETPLDDELDLLQRYLDIERVRFAGRLTVEVEVDPEARRALVPTLILQPLVENAIRHGIARRPGAGMIRVAARREGDALRLEVRDTGEGLPIDVASGVHEGVGLSNTRARLEQLYGTQASLLLTNADGGGARATIRLPFRAGVEHAHVYAGA